MCYHYAINVSGALIEKHFQKQIKSRQLLQAKYHSNGFKHELLPIIKQNDNQIVHYQWGLVPSWATDDEQAFKMQSKCLNARVESVHEKPALKKSCFYSALSYNCKWVL